MDLGWVTNYRRDMDRLCWTLRPEESKTFPAIRVSEVYTDNLLLTSEEINLLWLIIESAHRCEVLPRKRKPEVKALLDKLGQAKCQIQKIKLVLES
jgi:hypothetical protein